MVPVKLQNKIYGAVQEEYFRYIGFCKKVRSEEIQNVDVFVDARKIDTLACNKSIQKISKSYHVEGFSFEYDLPQEYIGSKHEISFICHDGELEGSPFYTISENDEKYNECLFMNSLYQPLDEKIKEMYGKNCIAFLAVKDNLADENFVNYIKELYVRFPQATFKAFYFNSNDQKMITSIFWNEMNRLELVIPKSIYDVANDTEVYINNLINKNFVLIRDIFLSNEVLILPLSFVKSNMKSNLNENDMLLYDKVVKHHVQYDIHSCKTRGEFRNFDIIKLCLKSHHLKSSINKFYINSLQE